ncbi:hypothetical protein [Amycolatopsis sp. PS_44_ISF1]|uniref:toxin-antitoxin system YwqK family antitoxin n=1 Tax=Amycolatopsis sp. PS_44_ISF1 TaxID=2974917 RepID=UPI0028DE12D6|nr:hypothetical protein [Amycolatopsis sp. PS_44_ISF1]MDT8910133.1 hypothetical protein [Amycolatopsis sp. PS_44_ISF1]
MLRIDESDLEWSDDNLPYYHDQPFTGECVESMSSGALVSLVTYEDGVADGPFKHWSPAGTLTAEGASKNGKPVGVWRHWYPGGAVQSESEFDDHGNLLRRRAWAEDGTPTEEYTAPGKNA